MGRKGAINAVIATSLVVSGCASVSAPSLMRLIGSGGNASADLAAVTGLAGGGESGGVMRLPLPSLPGSKADTNSTAVSTTAPTATGSLPNSLRSVFSALDSEGHTYGSVNGSVDGSVLGSTPKQASRKPAAAQKHRTARTQPPPHTFLIKPLALGRLTSGLGNRINPVTGISKRHNGIDYAAPRGTEVFAAGAGIVEYVYHSSSYGNYIRIRHADGYATAYAHLNNFANGIEKGVIVMQGQTIGSVGSTGQSTGPHLHYELIHQGRFVDPLSNRAETTLAAGDADISGAAPN